MPQFHNFLDALKYEGKDLFYKGDIAKRVSDDLKEGGHLTRSDFEQYAVHVKAPVTFDFFNKKICTTGFPSVGGMLLTALLNTYQDHNINKSPEFLSINHFQKLLTTFSSIQLLQNDARKISNYLMEHFGINTMLSDQLGGSKWGGTTHFNVVDDSGMTVCLTTSIGEGSGYFVPGTDMQMNNMLGEEALMPNGFHNWSPDVRLQSMMSPSLVVDNTGNTLLGIGSGGAGRIPYAICQAIVNIFYFGLEPAKAIDAPRIHIQGNTVEMEARFDFDTDHLDNLNVWDSKSLFFGGVNLIHQSKNHFKGFADQRRFGAVINSTDI